jgi:hypothetical protein
MKLIAGIDPGVKTGVALWDAEMQRYHELITCGIIDAMRWVCVYPVAMIVMEDARLRKGRHIGGVERLQGVGSIKRDCGIWTEFADAEGIPLLGVSPLQKGSKVDADRFAKLTGWTARTSNHSRDAGMLVWGRK